MDAITYINADVMILIPVIYLLGIILKLYVTKLDNKYIPLILLLISIIAACDMLKEISINSIIQGILVASVSVFGNQMWKQLISNKNSSVNDVEIVNEEGKEDNNEQQ